MNILSYIRNILQLFLAPKQAWEDIADEHPDVKQLVELRAIPMIAVAALTVFAQLIYHDDIEISSLIIKAAAIFATYFIVLFLSTTLLCLFLPPMVEEGIVSRARCTVFSAFMISALAVCKTLVNFLPLDLGLSVILPLCVGMIGWKANAYLGVERNKELGFGILEYLVVIVPVLLMLWGSTYLI